MAVAESRDSPTLTEKQAKRLDELESKDVLTDAMKKELAELLVKKENSTKIILSDTYINYLLDEYSWRVHGMVRVTKELMDIPQMQKGVLVEFESIKLLSMVDGVMYIPNIDENEERERIYNEYLSGEIDAYAGQSIMQATCVPDIKSIWDLPTFLCKIQEPVTKSNDWQIKGYMDISGAPQGFVANCLIDTPEHIVESLKWKLLHKLNVTTEEAPEFVKKWQIIEKSMRFSHISPTQRVFKKQVEPMTEHQRQFLYDRVKIGRDWLEKFHERYQNLNK